MDIEKLIEQLSARGLSNGSSLGYHSGLFDEAATALSTLQAENEKLRAELEQVRRERDAAQSLLAERIGVRGAEPITTAFGLPIDRLSELAKADREGRCVVLPCKVEDDVYINILGRTLPFTVISISQMSSTPTFKAQHGIRLVYIFKADDVEETVFLTRAEAEAALRREQNG